MCFTQSQKHTRVICWEITCAACDVGKASRFKSTMASQTKCFSGIKFSYRTIFPRLGNGSNKPCWHWIVSPKCAGVYASLLISENEMKRAQLNQILYSSHANKHRLLLTTSQCLRAVSFIISTPHICVMWQSKWVFSGIREAGLFSWCLLTHAAHPNLLTID